MSVPPVAEAIGVSRTYQLGTARVRALRGVSVCVGAAELVALAGPSGSGKSTLLHLLGCLDSPDAGTVRIAGRDVARLSPGGRARLRRDQLGFVFQSFNLVPVMTAHENVEYPLLLGTMPRGERRARVAELLDRVGLAAKAARRPHELSGGERQRVAIARALVCGPSLVLADEPTANLDSATGASVLDLMDDLRDRMGVTFLFASHDPRLLDRMDRVVTLRDGLVLQEEVAACA